MTAKHFSNTIAKLVVAQTLFFTCARAVELTHGPMIGHTTGTTARVWVRADGSCRLQVRAVPAVGKAITTERIRLVEADNFCGSVVLKGLSSSTTYSYRILLNSKEQHPSVLQEFTTFPPEQHRGILRVGFGHSLIGPGEQTTWRSIAEKKPDLFILMGDNIYSNTTDPAKQRRMYLQFRADPHFRAFAATTPIYAIWDDHDYGKNNSDRTQQGKERSLKTFNEIWANPLSQAGQAKGIWTRFTVGDSAFFLIDVRYHRSPNADPDGPDKTMRGAQQRACYSSSLRRHPKRSSSSYREAVGTAAEQKAGIIRFCMSTTPSWRESPGSASAASFCWEATSTFTRSACVPPNRGEGTTCTNGWRVNSGTKREPKDLAVG